MTEGTYRWRLIGHIPDSDTSTIQAFDVDSTPFRIGRQPGLSLPLPIAVVSGLHAEILHEHDSLLIRDLGSTNGTFVNGTRIREAVLLRAGDLIQIANVPFRLSRELLEEAAPPSIDTDTTGSVSYSEFDRFLRTRTVIPHYQPVIRLRDKSIVGYEVLARSRVQGLEMPREMFLTASQLNLEEELCRMLRLSALQKNKENGDTPCLFLNSHPAEIVSFGLVDSLRRLREFRQDVPMVLEIHEPHADDTEVVKRLHGTLNELNMRLAYDRFGAGQSRRVDLASVRPDFVKFDIDLIRDIHLAPAAQRAMLGNLVCMVHELGIVSVALGVECEAEHAICRDVGFELGQGFYYGKPVASVGKSMGREEARQLV
jgi:EAL domain-containing protein (putative c-di-GMP-specific phosphodiesterase class I)